MMFSVGPKNRESKEGQAGFTLVELLIATTVFSIILLLCTYGLIQIGNTFYKGRTAANTQNVTRNVMDNITQAIQYGGTDVSSSVADVDTDPLTPRVITDTDVEGSGAFCAGGVRYKYQKDVQVRGGSSKGLVVDNSTDCRNVGADGRELLGHNMSIAKLVIKQDGSNYTINLVVAYGDSDLRQDGRCKPGAGSQFCATAELTTTVQRRIQ